LTQHWSQKSVSLCHCQDQIFYSAIISLMVRPLWIFKNILNIKETPCITLNQRLASLQLGHAHICSALLAKVHLMLIVWTIFDCFLLLKSPLHNSFPLWPLAYPFSITQCRVCDTEVLLSLATEKEVSTIFYTSFLSRRICTPGVT